MTWLRRLLPLVVVAGLAMVLSREEKALPALSDALRQAHPTWLLVAALVQGLYLALYLRLQQAALGALAVPLPFRQVAALWARSLVVNVAAPGTGNALWIGALTQQAVAPPRAAAGLLLIRVADLSGFALLLLAGLAYLWQRGALLPTELLATGIFLLLVLAWALPLVLAIIRPVALQPLYRKIVTWAQRLHFPLSPDSAAHWAEETETLAGFLKPTALTRLIGFSLVAHLADLASFGLLLVAVGAGWHPGLMLAGFGAAVLFWVVTISPEGIGTSEGAAAWVLHQLGLPVATATAVALSFRALAFYLPLLAGMVLAVFRMASPRLSLRLVPPTIALLIAGAGIVNLISAVQPALLERRLMLMHVLPGVLRHGSRLGATFSGFALLIVSVGLLRHKRSAWVLAQLALVVSMVSHLGKGLDIEEATLSLVALLLLLAGRKYFHAHSDTPTMQRGLALLACASVFTLAYGTAGFYLLDSHYRVDFDIRAALSQTIQMFIAFRDPGLEPTTGYGAWFADSIYVVGAGALAYGLAAVLAPVFLRRPATPTEQQRAAGIVAAHGRSSVARFALFSDKVYWFSPGGSVVAYTVAGRVAVALGEPIGPERDLVAALAGFRRFCESNDWLPAFYHTLPGSRDALSEVEFATVCIGHEALVPLDGFSLAGGARKTLRRNHARVVERGYRGEVVLPPHRDALLDELEVISDSWLERRGGTEKQFSLGWFDRRYLQEGPLVLVRDPDGAVVAFANIIPEYQNTETTIDLMRRSDTESGVMELLFVTYFAWAQENGFSAVNLGLAPLAGIGESDDDPALDRAIHFLYEHLNSYYGFQGLHAFKEKFAPVWEPRYLAVPTLAAVPAAALAVVRADNGNRALWQLALRRGNGVHFGRESCRSRGVGENPPAHPLPARKAH